MMHSCAGLVIVYLSVCGWRGVPPSFDGMWGGCVLLWCSGVPIPPPSLTLSQTHLNPSHPLRVCVHTGFILTLLGAIPSMSLHSVGRSPTGWCVCVLDSDERRGEQAHPHIWCMCTIRRPPLQSSVTVRVCVRNVLPS